ncbi:PepSY domain-containing protein [Candidatus Omnitrophota bacterium]
MKFISIFFLAFFCCFVLQATASADFLIQRGEELPKGDISLEQCMAEATEHINGYVAIVEFKSQDGIPLYEFEIKAEDGTMWNVEVNAQTGLVVEFEKHVDPNSPEFKAQAKISAKEAEKAALSFMPGKIDQREYLMEPDGMMVYEFDIHTAYGGEIKVEIEAETGKLHRLNPEHWEIGEIE